MPDTAKGGPVNEAATELSEELGDIPVLSRLDEDQATRLLEMYRTASSRRSAEIREAQEASLKMVPRLLRGPLRKILFG
jgi:hypothetical protein